MKSVTVFLILIAYAGSVFSQEIRDKAAFVPYENKFYGEIKDGIKEFSKKEKKARTAFKMDYTGKDLPKSIEEFESVWCNAALSQGNTGTCWCFATSSFYEAEVFRLTKQEIKLSELYTVYYEYVEKATEYIRTRGKSFFGEGSETNAVARMMKKYGIVPASEYTGMKKGQKFHDHSGMYGEMHHYLKTLKRDNAWNEAEGIATIKSILNYYIGEPPARINWKGNSITPLQFMSNIAKIKPGDYVNFMSLVALPYYENAEYKVPDNWWKSDDYNNIPLDKFMGLINSSIEGGYSIAIGGDVSESGYSSEMEVAMVPSYDIPSEYIDEYARQLRFTNGSTTDDHAIHIIGHTKKGDDTWYLIKDSGSGSRNGENKGYYFYHEDYVKLKIMTFTVHKDAARDILKKMHAAK